MIAINTENNNAKYRKNFFTIWVYLIWVNYNHGEPYRADYHQQADIDDISMYDLYKLLLAFYQRSVNMAW